MQRSHRIGLVAIILSALAPFLGAQADATPRAPLITPAPPILLAQFDVHIATVQQLQVPFGSPPAVSVDVVLGGVAQRIALGMSDVRGPNFQLLERGPNGLVQLATPPCVTYRGRIVGDLGSDVAATVDGGSITAYARAGSGELWVVQPVQAVQPAAGPGLHVVFRAADSAALAARCGVAAANLPVPAPVGTDAVYAADLAVEADYPFYQLNGSNTTITQNDVTGIVNAMNVIYERDVDIRLVLAQVVVNSSPDPYTTSNANNLLTQFRNRWNAVYGGVQRDLAHLFSGRQIGAASGGTIGIAYVGQVCNISSAYGLSQSRYTTNYARRVAVTAHEIGHNFGAGHCNSTPPCHIMCSGIGGCGGVVTSFGGATQNQIIAYRQSVGCLSTVVTSPTLTSVTPASVKTVAPGLVNVTGNDLVGCTHATIAGQTVPVTVLSDTQLRFVPPQGLSLGFHTFNVTNIAGTSNSLLLTYTNANPAELLVPAAVLGGNTVTWTMGGVQNDLGILVISLTNTTSPWLGWNLVDNPVVFWQGGLDARGMATHSFFVPSMVFNGLQVYTQLIDIVGGTSQLRSLSTVKSTLVVL